MDYNNDYLVHYGILGMHWGIRRFQPYSVHPRKGGEGGKEVGDARKAQKRLAEEVSKEASTYRSSGGYRDNNGSWKTFSYRTLTYDQPKLKNRPEIRKAFDELSAERQKVKDAGKVFNEFAKLDRRQMQKYLDKAADDTYDNSSDYIKASYDKEEFRNLYQQEQWFADDDSRGPIAQYMKDKGYSYSDERKKLATAQDVYYEKAKSVSEKLLGEYGNKKVRQGGDSTVKEAVTKTLERLQEVEDPESKAYESFYDNIYRLKKK